MNDKNIDKNKNKKNGKNANNKKGKSCRRKRARNVLFLIIGVLIGSLFIQSKISGGSLDDDTIKTYNEFVAYVEDGLVEQVDYDSSHKYMFFKLKDEETMYQTDNPRVNTFKEDMLLHDVTVNEVEYDDGNFMSTVQNVLFMVVQYGLIMGMFMIIFKKIQGGTDEMQIQTSSTSTFEDVAGLEEVKESLMTTVDMLKNPKKYEAAGARISKGAILYGPPGTGKTLLAKAIAGEAGVNFLAMSGSDFDNKYVGVGADKVRKIFDRAKKLAPCIVFIDELDAIGGRRTESDKAYERQTLNQLLSCMDGFSENDGVFIFAATNDIGSLDAALLRPGRFDSRFAVGLPDTTRDRIAIINLYMKNKIGVFACCN